MTTKFGTEQKSQKQSAVSVPFSRIVLIVAFSFVFFGVALWMVIPAPPVGFYWDDTWYLLMAEWLTSDSTYRGLAWSMMWVTSYPPLFPLFVTWSGASLVDQQSAFVMNALFLASGTGVAMLWFVREKFSAITMTFAGTLVMFNPVTLGYLPILYSEFLFTLLSTIALALVFLAREWRWNSKWLVIGLIVGLSIATRTAGWTLVVGLLVHLVLGRKLLPAVVLVTGVGVSVLIIPFLMVGIPPSGNYAELFTANLDNIGLNFLVQQFMGLVTGWNMLWGWGVGAWLAVAAVLPGLIVRLKANRADAWYVVMYFGMLLVWPFPGHMGRFLWPLLPCFLVSAHSSFYLLRNFRYRSVLASVLMGVILAISIPDGIGRSLERLLEPPEGDLFQLSRMHEWTRSSTREEGMVKLKMHQQFLKDLQRIDEIVDSKACIYSEFSSLVAIQTRRVSYAPPWHSLDDVGSRKAECEYYYMLPPSMPGTSTDAVNRFSAVHEELFRSVAPNDPEGKELFGVFLRFRVAAGNRKSR